MRLWILYAHRVVIECEKECKITLNGEEMEEVNKFKDLGSVMCKHGGTEGETRERALQERKVVGSLGRIMNGRSVSMEVKKDLRNTVIVSPGHLRHQLRYCIDDGTIISSTLNAMTLKLKKRRNDVGANTLSQINFCVIFLLKPSFLCNYPI